jgi:hypothetical protein
VFVLAVIVGAGAVTGSIAVPRPAWAQPGAGDTKASDPKQRADAAYKEGLALNKAGNHEAALAKFEAANALLPSGMALYQIARMEQLLARHALALQHFREALRETTLTVDARRDAEKSIDDLKTKIGIIVLDVPGGASVTVDGNDVDPKNAVEVVPGLHVVNVKLAAETRTIDVTAPAGAVTPVKARFDEPTNTRPPPTEGTAPLASPTPPRAQSFWTTGRIVGTTAVAAGIVSLGVGIGFAAASGSAGNKASRIRTGLPAGDSACTDPANTAPCADLRTAVDDQHSDKNLRNGFLVAGVVLAIGGAVVFAVSAPKHETTGTALIPFASTKEGGLAVSGRF